MRRLAPAALTAVLVAAALRLFDAWYLNYDARYALLWARDAFTGHLPEYTADFAPTPHVLQMAASALALPFGNDGAGEVVLWMVLLSFGALVWLTFRLGGVLFGFWAGVVAAAVVATRPAFLRDAALAYQDIPFAALVVGAVLLEAQRPRRGAPVLVLLALAGLLRPEAWVLSGAYVLWLWRDAASRRRIGLVALAAIGPVVWAATDWIVTGDPLHSLHGTSALAIENERRRTLGEVPRWGAEYLGFTLREPVLIGVAAGLVCAWYHARRRAVLPLAVAAVMLLVFAVGPIFGLPLIGRYVRTPAALLMLFYGLACAGWLLLPDGTARRRWRAAGVVALLLSVAYLPWHVSLVRGLGERTERDRKVYGTLRDAMRDPAVRRHFDACAPLTAADHRPIPYARWWLEGAPGSVTTVEGGESPLGDLFLMPRSRGAVGRLYRKDFPRARPPEDYRRIYANAGWTVWAAPGCVTRPPS